jgi:hypothetical protein
VPCPTVSVSEVQIVPWFLTSMKSKMTTYDYYADHEVSDWRFYMWGDTEFYARIPATN